MKYTPAQLKSRARYVSKYKVDGRPMTLDDYEARMVEQNRVCAFCLRPPKNRALAVDHAHRAPDFKTRGLLCMNCNRRILGWMERLRVDPRRIVAYFEKHDPEYLNNICRK